jgi:CHAT domain-containing protein
MKIISLIQKQLPYKLLIYLVLSLILIIPIALLSCGTKQMTLDEAMQATISMRGPSFVPPPRNVDDILDVIAKESSKDALAGKEWVELSKEEAPSNATKKELIEFYSKRGNAAFVLGSFEQSRDDLQKAYELAGAEKVPRAIISKLAGCEKNLGNFEKAVALATFLKERHPGVGSYAILTDIFATAGYFEKADSTRNEGIAHFKNSKIKSTHVVEMFMARMEYFVLTMRAKYKEAEPFIRRALTEASKIRPPRPEWVHVEKIRLISNLINQNRLVEAEVEARQVIEQAIQYFGLENLHFITAISIFTEVLLAQGRIIEAERVSNATLQAYEQIGFSHNSPWFLRSKISIGDILFAKGDYSKANDQYDFFRQMKESNRYIYDMYYRINRNVMLALVMTGRIAEANELIENAYQISQNLLGKSHAHSAELSALRGMVNHSIGNLESAYQYFSNAIPLMISSKTYTENRLSRLRFMHILENYLSLLSKLKGSFIENRYSFSAAAKALAISTLMNGSAVQAAVLESTARMTINDPKLKMMARTEQDAQQQIKAYLNLIQNLVSNPADKIDRQAIYNLKSLLNKLIAAREVVIDEIERQFPDYANLVNYRQPSLDNIQSRLKADEVIISISTTENSTYVFAVHPSGSPEMVRLQIGRKGLEELVSGIKKSLYPNSFFLGQLPPYDFSKAYELYSLLLKPIEDSWKNSKHLIFSTSGPLGQIPFSILITKPFQIAEEKEILFSNYRNAPWLIKRLSINTVPSIGSLVALRSISRVTGPKEAFVGFGDPLFNKSQLTQALNENKIHQADKNAQRIKLDIRGIRIIKDGNLDDKMLASCKIEALERLPDTADELLSLAEALNADPVRDVYLGKKASEKLVKSMDLSNRQVVAFASHALVPYDLDGLDQPAIALSAPSVTGDKDDGLLTMAEILDLKLNADWVVLSACNTGAAEGAGAEAVSGLGRAFFYAGTKAVLVSMWPVETSSAKKMTTSIFQHLKENVDIDKAQAHQMAMIELIEGPGLLDKDGRIIASYAHPLFWAPFIIVGDHVSVNRN